MRSYLLVCTNAYTGTGIIAPEHISVHADCSEDFDHLSRMSMLK